MFFIDIETVPGENPKELSAPPVAYWKKFAGKVEGEAPELFQHYKDNAAFYAEFGKIVCVCIGFIKDGDLRIKTFCSRYEKIILTKVGEVINSNTHLCAHNGYDFDFPFLFRRYLINGLPIPKALDINHLKKWEWPLCDTMTMWSHSAWNHKASLDLICTSLGIETPKQDMTGADVAEVYYGMFGDNESLPFDQEEAALSKIGKYCQGDVVALAKLYCKLKGNPLPTKITLIE